MSRPLAALGAAIGCVALVLVGGCSGGDGPSDVLVGVATLQDLIDEPAESPDLTIGDELGATDVELTRYAVSYPSGDLTITGLIALPEGEGPHPALVVLHGYERGSYSPLSSMAEFYGPLVEAGYLILFPDLRNYGGSDTDDAAWNDHNVSGTRDAANAVRALAGSGLADPDRIGVLGLSEGGRLALATDVVVPDLLRAVVAMSPMSTDAWDNVQRFMSAALDSSGGFLGRGTPETQPEYWAGVNPATFAGRTSAPLLVVAAGADETCDPAWAEEAADAWLAAGRDATLVTIDGASHVYAGQVDEAMAPIVDFLARHLG